MISDPEHILICAVEHVLPRHTYLVMVVADEVRRRWTGLGPDAKRTIGRRIAAALNGDATLWPMDRVTWASLLEWCENDGGRKVDE